MKYYNESRKLAYLEISGNEYNQQLFARTSAMEHYYHQDLCELDVDKLQKLYGEVSGTLRKSNSTAFLAMRRYIRWCSRSGLMVSDAIDHIETDEISKYRKRSVGSPMHLKKVMDAVFPDPSRNEMVYIYKTFLWLAYLGLTTDEALTIESMDIDPMRRTIHVKSTDKVVKVYQEAWRDIQTASTIESFAESRGDHAKLTIRKRLDGTLILRGKQRANIPTGSGVVDNALRPAISRVFSNPPMEVIESDDIDLVSTELTYQRVYQSGVFYREFIHELEGLEPSFRDAIDDRIRETEYIGEIDIVKSRISSELFDDYERWKSIYGHRSSD